MQIFHMMHFLYLLVRICYSKYYCLPHQPENTRIPDELQWQSSKTEFDA